ncbi:carbohydrate-binding protein [Bacteroidia bacterium]|nr:carbohydrate-binding protein [Bacteroidia bacterium]
MAIGDFQLPVDGFDKKDIKPGGFRISTLGGTLRIVGNSDRSSVYGVAELLERYLGVEYLGAGEYTFTPSRDIVFPAIDITDNPAFSYRQIPSYMSREDAVYKLWHRLETPDDVFAGGYWVHTFDHLLPSDVYGKEHPEYYSWFRGKRNPGKASQWCLTNDEVFEIVSARIDSIFRANPGSKIISVSQNDGNYTNCQCEKCKAIDDYEGSPSGSLIRFLNKLASRFPDKQFSTLAYLYTMHPPKHTRPLPNVNIMLCDIDCDREVSLTENASGRDFVKALTGWSAISDNIYVWDYAINFDNYLSPFPNFHILQPNIRLFRDNHVTMHHCQMSSSLGTNFCELRSWLAAKLMWNPDADVDALMHRFLNGYYGAAAPYLYRYIKMMEGALLGSGSRLWIYDSPVTFKEGMLRPELLTRYAELVDSAEKAVAGDDKLQKRVRRERLTLQYSELEILRTRRESAPSDAAAKLSLFESRVNEFGVTTLNERNNSPQEYCALYRQRFMPSAMPGKSLGAQVTFIEPPTGKYVVMGESGALTDGLFGGSTFVESWVGWEGKDGSLTVDLGEQKEFTSVSTDFLHQLGAWILLPQEVNYSISVDGTHYTAFGGYSLPEDRSPQVKYVAFSYNSTSPVTARYIRVDVKGVVTCPEWHYGVGHPCWFFMDEITVE